jgi:hypothetical protein
MFNSRTRISLAAAAVAAALTLTACGGSDGPSRADFVKNAEAVCNDVNAQLRALGNPADIAEFKRMAPRAIALMADGNKRLGDVKAPKDLQDDYDSLLASLDEQAADVREASEAADDAGVTAALARETAAQRDAVALAKGLGLPACAKTSS